MFWIVCDKDESVNVKLTVESLYKVSGGLMGLIVPAPVLPKPTVLGISFTEFS